jgi:hypothetical protein
MALFKVLQVSITSTLGKWEANKLHPSVQVDEEINMPNVNYFMGL